MSVRYAPRRRAAAIWTAVFLVLLAGCGGRPAGTPPAPSPVPSENAAGHAAVPAATPAPAIVWPEGDYTALDEAGRAAYREALSEQLPADSYLILEDGFVVESEAAGRYTPEDFAALLPDVALPTQAVGGYALREVYASFGADPLARPGDRILRRYRFAADNLQGATLVYADEDGRTVRVNLIGLAAIGGAPAADAEIHWSAEPVRRAEEDGRPVYGLDGTLGQPSGQAIVQLHAAAEDETAFLTAMAPFTAVESWVLAAT